MRTAVLAVAALATVAFAQIPYDQNRAMQALYYSGAAYCAYDTVDNWDCGLPCRSNSGFRQLRRFNNPDKNTFAYSGYNPNQNQIVLSFRGTNGVDLSNWMTNLNGFRTDYPGIAKALVHTGFINAYNAIAVSIRNEIRSLTTQYRTASILVTGHSLGGALATLAALDIRRNVNPSNPLRVITFGQPRVGNDDLSNYLFQTFPNDQFLRITHADDPVVRLPMRLQGYRHTGQEIWYPNRDHDGRWQVCQNFPFRNENDNCATSYTISRSVSSHLNYIGVNISGSCTRQQPSGTLAAELFAEELMVFDNELFLNVEANESLLFEKNE